MVNNNIKHSVSGAQQHKSNISILDALKQTSTQT